MKNPVSIVLYLGALLLTSLLLSGCRKAPSARPASTPEISALIQANDAPLILVHAWATWCQPCRTEFPELIKVYRDYSPRGLSMILLSADDPEDPAAVEAFLHEQASPLNSLIATRLDEAFIESLSPDWSGALPATFLFDAKGALLASWEGQKSYAHYAETIEILLTKTQGGPP